MKRSLVLAALGLLAFSAPVRAQVTFQYLFTGGVPEAMSNDGSVITGTMMGGYLYTYRWTQATGAVALGRAQHYGAGGTPGISADGTRIASSIASPDSSYTTEGLWTLGSGWQELMPPTPPDGGTVDGAYGNVYGLSGDGSVVVGLYWRPGVGNRAHASKWTQATGVVDLGGTITGQASRANGCNFDGSVITGWVETPTGPWRPAAWVNGTLVLLTNYDNSGASVHGSGEGRRVSPNGDYLVGFASDSASNQRAATMWKRTGGVFGPPQVLGWVAGSTPGYGINIPYGVSTNGKLVAGYCSFSGDPFYTTGFVWTPTTGVLDVNEFLGNNGVYVDPTFGITSCTGVTPDGTKILGYGRDLIPPYTYRAFMITLPQVDAVPPSAPVAQLELSAPSPNPSSVGARLDFALARASSADLSIFDASGRRVATLLHRDLPPGRQSVSWTGHDGSGVDAPAGLYFARLSTAEGAVTRRLVRIP
jgi:hypothetical protein